MPEVVTEQTYTTRMSAREYRIVTQALARAAGLLDVNMKPEDIVEAGELNKRMLSAQAAVLRQQLEFVERKIDLADAEDQPKEQQADERAPRTLTPRRPMYRGGEKD